MAFKYVTFYMDGFFFDILGDSDDLTYDVCIRDIDKDITVHHEKISRGMHIKLFDKYFKHLLISVKAEDKEILSVTTYELIKGRRFFINMESESLGDTIAWMGVVAQFAAKHPQTEIIVSTFHNYLFKNAYPNIIFAERGELVNNLWGQATLGIYYDKEKNPREPMSIPLHQVAGDIICIRDTGSAPKPLIDFTPLEPSITTPYFAIGTESTSDLKEWPNKYWQQLINELSPIYKCVDVSKNPKALENTVQIGAKSIVDVMQYIHHAAFFVGLSSGLSWLAWAMGKKVYMIANFSLSWYEFKCTRFTNTASCHGCWNNTMHRFNKSRTFCPFNKGTSNQYICQRSIEPKKVIDTILMDRELEKLSA